MGVKKAENYWSSGHQLFITSDNTLNRVFGFMCVCECIKELQTQQCIGLSSPLHFFLCVQMRQMSEQEISRQTGCVVSPLCGSCLCLPWKKCGLFDHNSSGRARNMRRICALPLFVFCTLLLAFYTSSAMIVENRGVGVNDVSEARGVTVPLRWSEWAGLTGVWRGGGT